MSDLTNSPTSPAIETDGVSADSVSVGSSPTLEALAALESPQRADALIRCFRCQADLSGDRRAGRFCPRCGARRLDSAGDSLLSRQGPPDELPDAVLSDSTVAAKPDGAAAARAAVPSPTEALAAAWQQLSMAQAGPKPMPEGAIRDDVHSLMLQGYANAMFRLGWRYETGLGSGHNPQEALRCYFKAAKLGNAAALSRLAPQCVAPTTRPEPIDATIDGAVATDPPRTAPS